jgi:hypothetical protein
MTRYSTPRCLLALTLVLPLAACNDDDGDDKADEAVGDGDGDTDDGTPGDGDGAPGDGDGAPGDGDGDTGDGDGDDETGDGDGEPGDGDGDDPPPKVDNSTYTAVLMPGVPDRITITRINTDDPSCTRLILLRPGFDMFDITMPPMWAIDEVMVWQQGFCPMDNANPHGTPTTGGAGKITYASQDALGTYPCSLNFDFEMDMATSPALETYWKKNGVPVSGVNCG